LVFDSLEEYRQHLKSDLYRFNLKRKAAGLAPISVEQWNQIKETKERNEREEIESSDNERSEQHIKMKNRGKVERKKREIE
jgi:tRNA U34 5-carboxymethylaminomethyl modifying enzyme MnmG/GidA